ncbi:YkoP family protein [Pseudogracilibacillus auburnensis]|uniref:YkoP family protein n=1 Tax=Pseudogracilibacillus auburnensis TaxID=1494959 RepID=UPI001A95BD55|nr:hypothetical protein [Pseudogracilibacillus auburnensis]MBO1001426.1 hypothetical protein [Pseudogracilibacillus auburnensis]
MSRKKKLIISLWMLWDKLFYKFFHIQPIDKENPLLCARVRTYRGKPIHLSDGEVIKKGDHILELHLNNKILFNMVIKCRSPLQLAVQMVRATESSLRKTSTYIQNHPKYKQIKGLYGVSIIHRGAKRFGFNVINIPKGPFSFFVNRYLCLLLFVVHLQGKQRLQTKSELLVPKIIAISKKEFMQRNV